MLFFVFVKCIFLKTDTIVEMIYFKNSDFRRIENHKAFKKY